MELDTGPWTRKSSTLCSLLLLLTIAAFAVPGQVNSEEVGLGKHTKTGKQVELSSKMEKANETNFNSDDYKKRFPNACDVKIHNGTITTTTAQDALWTCSASTRTITTASSSRPE
uniref:Lipocalin n=1 Tax=Meloidogyne hapla TaxID=6305 RepID=A0A1I8AYY2_MELHA